MSLTLKIALLNIPASPALESHISKHADKLQLLHPGLTECAVTVDVQSHHVHGNQYAVRLELTVPGGHFAVSRIANEDAYVAIRDAFEAAERQLAGAKREPSREVPQSEL